jgi:hypothetical protein
MYTAAAEHPVPELEPTRASLRWHRWPCPRCGHRGRQIRIVCPDCEALPWTVDPSAPNAPSADVAAQVLRAGTELTIRREGLLPRRHRFSTPTGFLGVLTYRAFGGADWLGVDGREWRLGRVGLVNRTYLILDGPRAIAAAQGRGIFLVRYELWQGNRVYSLVRTGMTHRSFCLHVEDGPEVLRIRSGFVNPLRRVEVLSEVPIATVVLASYLVRRMRHGEGS